MRHHGSPLHLGQFFFPRRLWGPSHVGWTTAHELLSHLEVSKKWGYPKSSTFMGFPLETSKNYKPSSHWGTTISGNFHLLNNHLKSPANWSCWVFLKHLWAMRVTWGQNDLTHTHAHCTPNAGVSMFEQIPRWSVSFLNGMGHLAISNVSLVFACNSNSFSSGYATKLWALTWSMNFSTLDSPNRG